MLKIFKALMASLFIATLAACGGGGGSAGTPVQGGTGGTGGTGGATGNGQIGLVLFDSSGTVNNVMSSTAGLIAKATVTDSNGVPAKNIVVTFTLDSAIATLSPTSGTVLTDSNGVAQITLKPGTGVGAGSLTATAAIVGTTSVSTKAAYSVNVIATAAVPAAINFVSAVPSDKSIVIKGAGGNGRTEVALLTFSVVDSTNTGVANIKVNFSTQSTNPVTLSAISGLTDMTGKVTVAVNSGTQPTTARVVATVDGTSISSLSDTLTVTTGVPVQSAMSLSLSKFWVEGLNWDNQTIKVTALLADSFGGAVADGTQVVFTTNVGAVIGIGGALCLTNGPNITTDPPFPGFCDVVWRSQNPRSNGIGTIIATATNGTDKLSQSATFYVLGSYAKIYQVSPTSVEGNTTRLTTGGPMTLNLSCPATLPSAQSPTTLKFEIVDANDNPMPPGSTITATQVADSSTGAAGGATVSLLLPAPVTVPMWNIGQLGIGVATQRGTVHTLTVTPPATCVVGGATAHNETFNITVTSPLGGVTNTAVTLSYKTTP